MMRVNTYHPCANQHAKKKLQIQLNWERLKFVSYTSKIWERMFDFRRYREFSRGWFRIFKVTSKTLGLGIHPIDNAEPPFVDRPKIVKSTNSGQKKACQDDFRTYIGQFSNHFQFFLFELMVIQAWSRDFVQLFIQPFCSPVRNIFPRISSHDSRPSDSFRVRVFTTRYLSSCSGWDSWFENVCIHVEMM